MDKHEQQFLMDQLHWCKQQEEILAEIEMNLLEMKSIAILAVSQTSGSDEVDRLTVRFEQLSGKVRLLEQQLISLFH